MFPILPAGSPEVADTRLPAFVVAHDGLYLRKQSLLGLSQTKVDGVDHLPAESRNSSSTRCPRSPRILMARVVGFFRSVYREASDRRRACPPWRAYGLRSLRAGPEGEPGFGEPHARRGRAASWAAESSGRSTATGPSVPGRVRSTKTTRRSSMVSTSSSATSTEGVPPTRRPLPSMGIGSRSGRASSSNDHGGSSSRRRTGCGG